MNLRAAMDAFRASWSDEHVCRVARAFLAKCNWVLEADEDSIRVPPDTELVVYSAALIVADTGFGDHAEAIVYLGAERSTPHILPVHGVLRLYLDDAGNMITEDRYTPAQWRNK